MNKGLFSRIKFTITQLIITKLIIGVEFLDIQELKLIKKAQQKDISAFTQLVKNHEREIRICLAARLDEIHEAEDLAQETFIVAFRRIEEFSPERPIKYWFKAIALNLLKNHRRKVSHIAAGDANDIEQLIATKIERQIDEQLERQDENILVNALNSCTEALNENAKKLIKQYYSEGYSVADLTQIYQTRHSTITMRLHRMRDKLRECINQKLSEEV
ncbi:RNA polymerase sigma factor [Catenovulum sediminis]|uniref:RNA polymerase sigma factor n=1 Tax=Catenovulum sediminis TaxID=1740262 RepID=UPI001180509B|nr:sigma-70 family RNA polymerase sigma factor [Catenovulum sediminis]